MNLKEIFLDFAGFFLLLIFIAQTLVYIVLGEYIYIWWFSNHVALIAGLAILYRSSAFLTAEVIIGLFPETIWMGDFLYSAITGKSLLGVTAYLTSLSPLQYALALQHLLVIPLAFLCLYFIKPNEKGMIIAFVHSLILWATGYILSSELNINCSHSACISFLNYPFYVLLWPLFGLLFIFFSYKIIAYVCESS